MYLPALKRKKKKYMHVYTDTHAYICRSTNIKQKGVMQKHLILLMFDEITAILGSKKCMNCFKAI